MRIVNASLMFVLLIAIALPAAANPLPDPWCDWEHGETVFYTSGDGDPAIVVTNDYPPEPAPYYDGSHALLLHDAAASGTPYAVVAYVFNLSEGNQVTAGFWRYDTTPGTYPSCRIWGHWNDAMPGDLTSYDGTAGGNEDYGPGTAGTTWSTPGP